MVRLSKSQGVGRSHQTSANARTPPYRPSNWTRRAPDRCSVLAKAASIVVGLPSAESAKQCIPQCSIFPCGRNSVIQYSDYIIRHVLLTSVQCVGCKTLFVWAAFVRPPGLICGWTLAPNRPQHPPTTPDITQRQ